MHEADLVIRGAREHNLRNVNLRLPRNRLIVMTGVSGSGKSSLAFDTLYAEGQRRYVESLSSYARQFLGQLPKPEVDSISGLAPSISIQQKTSGKNPRSTVGTITEIYDYLRVLYARVGVAHCPECQQPISAQTREQIASSLAALPAGARYLVLAPVVQQQKGEYRDLFDDLLKQGFLRARVDGRVVALSQDLKLDRYMRHTIEVVVDRLTAGADRARVAEAVDAALRLGRGNLVASIEPEAAPGRLADQPQAWRDLTLSAHYACAQCGVGYEPPNPQLFSFNSPQGMCLGCHGLGVRHEFRLDLLIPDPSLSLLKGAVALVGPLRDMGRWRRHILEGAARAIEQECGLPARAALTWPWDKLPEPARQMLLFGTGARNITFAWRQGARVWKHGGTFAGIVNELHESYRTAKNPMRRRQLEKFMQVGPCHQCQGARLNPFARFVRVASESFGGRSGSAGPASLTLPEVCALSIAEAARFFEKLALGPTSALIAEEALKEIRGRLGFLLRCGLNYLSLDRAAPTLSGGESQRIRLASQIGCGLVGVVYILDEPSIGLHPRDNRRLLDSLIDLRDQGNTVIVVEHDEETIRAADHIVDFGPGPGVRGGQIVAEGSLARILEEPKSLTGRYLGGRAGIERQAGRRGPASKALVVRGARHNNLRGIDVTIPLERFVCVTGVSGSGKSSLVNDILWEALHRDLNGGEGNPGAHERIEGLEHLDKAIDIDQSPIGRTPRSNPATYVKLADQIRDLFARLPEARQRGFKPGRFSFNVPGGRCEGCEGNGATRLEMDFLADLWVTCPVCGGHRFDRETLEVRYKGASIADVLEMDVQQALTHFQNLPHIEQLLRTLHDVGLDYIKLGQPSPTLSGGEAQRIKLARELGKRSTGRTIYLLDEPTTGLHFEDVRKLLEVLHGLVDKGNSVLVVEHNLDVIRSADWIIDLGPEGGALGGAVVAQGTPEDVARFPGSHTGRALAAASAPRGAASGPGHVEARRAPPPAAPGSAQRSIVVRGAAQHNLRHIDVEIPRNALSVFSGPSGSGKSSLAMDTLYAEGQRRYVESLSAYARQFLGQMPKPRVEHVSGLSPAIAIEQKSVGNTPRSTVGTVTEIHDYLRILYARLGQPYCPECAVPVESQTADQVVARLMKRAEGTRLLILAPVSVDPGDSYPKLWERLRSQGYGRVRLDKQTFDLKRAPEVDRRRRHEVEIVVDRVTVSRGARSRLAGSVEQAFAAGRGAMRVASVIEGVAEPAWPVEPFSLRKACQQCGRNFEELSPQHFSFNSPLGWCPACMGLGTQLGTNLAVLIDDPKRSINEGAIRAWPAPGASRWFRGFLDELARETGLPLDVPFAQLDPQHAAAVLYGTGERWFTVPAAGTKARGQLAVRVQYKGLYPAVEEASKVSYALGSRLAHLAGEVRCTVCGGSRLRTDAAAYRFQGKTLGQLCDLPLDQCLALLRGIKLDGRERRIAGDLLREATSRLQFLVDVGLNYLTLARTMPTLSGGECQRIRLAGQVGRGLCGVLYVLDEPTIGLHPRDNGRLLAALARLRDLGNTVVLVEHDQQVIEASDRLYDFGPGAGRLGGRIVAQGAPRELARDPQSLTGRYLSGKAQIPIPEARRLADGNSNPPGGAWLELTGARHHNLRQVDARIPLGALTCVTGVSGSGKSSLVLETLAVAAARHLHGSREMPGAFDELRSIERLNKVIVVDQQPLGTTPASNPATYTGVFDEIREVFARLPEAKVRGYRPSRFSFNRPGGRCEACEGNGQKRIEMHFLPDVWVECDACRGKRFNPETLEVRFKGQSIAGVLEMSIGQARELFDNIPKVRGTLATLCAVGLDYLTLGQSAATLSGGEAQRVKLAAELSRPQTGRTLYVLDEPTTGLHFDDIRKLLMVLHGLVEAGNTVVVIEHNLDVIKTADWIIDMGPEAGQAGGQIVACGTPEEVVGQARLLEQRAGQRRPEGAGGSEGAPVRSHTGLLLERVLKRGERGLLPKFDAQEAARKRGGDLDIKEVGRATRAPWQVDGRRWHTRDRLSHDGLPCRWEGAALEYVIDRVAADGSIGEINWNDRSVVEAAGRGQAPTWFLHALTGDEWLLELRFRVRQREFNESDLRRELGLKEVDDLDELPIYGRAPRVRVKNRPGFWQEVAITVHWLREIDTPAFRRFLDRALQAYRNLVAPRKKIDQNDLLPWKLLGRKWHLSRTGFPGGQRAAWPPELLSELAELLERTFGGAAFDWASRDVAVLRDSSTGQVRAKLFTKRRDGLDLVLYAPAGQVALGRIASLGAQRKIEPGDDRDEVTIRLVKTDQIAEPAFRKLLGDLVLAAAGAAPLVREGA